MERFSKAAFVRADVDGKEQLAAELGQLLAERIRGATTSSGDERENEFHRAVHQLIEELRGLGHDLWSFDASPGEFEIWCPNYHEPTGPGIAVTFRMDDGVEVDWCPHLSGG